jgi:DnaJ family protein A protein 2
MTYKLYDLLGIQKGASAEDIKRAYKKAAVQHHPDKGGDPEVFKEVSAAYQLLSNGEERQRYDALGDDDYKAATEGGGGGGGFDPSSIFEQFFGGGGGFGGGFGGGGRPPPRGPRRCPDYNHVMHISLAEAFKGIKKTIKVSVQRVCKSCVATCYTCQGVGHVTQVHRMGVFTQMMQRPCETCSGRGMTCGGKKDCNKCGGKGPRTEDVQLELDLSPGVASGYSKRFPGYGEQGWNSNERSGDLVINVQVDPHPTFERVGDQQANLKVVHTLTLVESIVGSVVEVPGLEPGGEPICSWDTSAAGIIQPDVVYSVTGKGMPKGEGGARGNLLLSFKIVYPKGPLTAKQRAVLTEAFATCKLGTCK